jgi:hypothetical protein
MLNVNMTKKAFADERNTPRLRITFNDSQTISQNDIISAKLTEMLADNNITMGSTFSQSFEIVMRMPETAIPLTGSYFTAKTSFDGMLWADLGTFYVSSTSTSGEQITVTASDKMASLTDDYAPSVPLTAAQILTDICNKYSLATEGISMPDVTLTEAYEGTVRDYIGWLAGLCGGNARFNRYGKLTFDWFSQISNIYGDATLDHKVDVKDVAYINQNLLGTVATEDKEAILGRMIVGKAFIAAEVKDYIRAPLSDVNQDGIVDSSDVAEIQAYIDGSPYDPTLVGTEGTPVQLLDTTRIERNGFTMTARDTCKIYALVSGTDDNPIESGTGRAISFYNPLMTQEALDDIVEGKLPIEYTSAEITYRGCPTWEVGDIIRVEADKSYNVPIMYHELSFGSKLEGSIKSYALSDEEESTLSVLPDVKTVERQLPEIKQVIADINSTLLSGDKGYMVLDEEVIDGVKRLSGFKIMDTPSVSSITKGWQASKNGIGWSSDGFKTISKLGLDMANGKIYADQIAAGSILTNSFQIGSDGTGMTFDGSTGKITFGSNVELSWSDITDKPSIPTSTSDLTNDSGFINSATATKITNNAISTASISANQITTGTLDADRIGAGSFTITGGSINIKTESEIENAIKLAYSSTTYSAFSPEGMEMQLGSYWSYASSTGFLVSYNNMSSYTQISPGAICIDGNDVLVKGGDINVGQIKSSDTYDDTVSYATNMYIGTTGILHRTTTTSSRDVKHDIEPISDATVNPELLYDAEVVQFRYNDDILPTSDPRYEKLLAGFIVEDLIKVYPTAVDVDENGKAFQWNGQYLIPPMLALIQKQHKEIDELKKKVEALS